MGNIVLLDELTINQIAAGEVIERPASAIKEMVENAIDAGANNISIEIKNGGISYIRITDNGKGIASDDIEIAFERHATSKIRSAQDLHTIQSMGFRGEALASIAAIAKVELISRNTQETVGNKIVVEGGKVLQKQEIGCPVGTTITVENLFYNTPVRYKFLKKDFTEAGYIEDVVTHLALIHPEISFRFINSGKVILKTSGNGNMKDIVYSIYGKEVASAILEVDYTYEAIKVTGVVGKPQIARSNRSNQLFFVNARYIKDRILSSASDQAYKGLLPMGKSGFVILNIQMNPQKVDVNVHPAKLEVRFEEENKVFKAVFHAIKDTLLKGELVPSALLEEEKVPFQMQKETQEQPKAQITYQQSQKQWNTEEVVPKISNIEAIPENMDILNQIRKIQEDLKKEVENNPNLHSNIDKIMFNQEQTVNLETVQKETLPKEKEGEAFKEIAVQKEEAKADDLHKTLEQKQLEAQEKLIKLQQEYQIKTSLKEEEEIKQEEGQQKDILPEEIEQEEIPDPMQEIERLKREIQEETQIDLSEKNEITKEEKEKTAEYNMQELLDKIKDTKTTQEAQDFGSMYQKIFGTLPTSKEKEKEEEKEKADDINASELIKENNISLFEESEQYDTVNYQLIGIAFSTYIIIQMGQELYIIDQHAAHERILYEKIKRNYYSQTDKDSQMLLLPDVITLTNKEWDIAHENKEIFNKAGFSMEDFGDNTIKLTGVPNICIDLNTSELFLETLDEINTVARTAKQEIEEKFIATVACKAAVKAKKALTKEEVDSLIQKLLQLPNPFTCPHGRPTAIRMNQADIEKKFGRRK